MSEEREPMKIRLSGAQIDALKSLNDHGSVADAVRAYADEVRKNQRRTKRDDTPVVATVEKYLVLAKSNSTHASALLHAAMAGRDLEVDLLSDADETPEQRLARRAVLFAQQLATHGIGSEQHAAVRRCCEIVHVAGRRVALDHEGVEITEDAAGRLARLEKAMYGEFGKIGGEAVGFARDLRDALMAELKSTVSAS